MDQTEIEQPMMAQLPDGRVVQISAEMAQMLKEAEEAAMAERSAKLNDLGQALAKKRKTAIDNRRQSGIEDEWDTCDDAYQGIDDANRTKTDKRRRYSKLEGSVGESYQPETAGGSTVFMNITKPYVDAAAARAGDMLLPTDDKFFEIEPTTIPDLIQGQGMQMVQLPNGQQATQKQLLDAIVKEAKTRSEAAYKRIDDWLGQCRFSGEFRRCLDDASRLGSGVMKGPYPVKRRRMSFMQDAGNGQPGMVIQESIEPESRCIPVRNLFPDYPACGDDIHRGSFVWEFEEISAKALRDMAGMEGVLQDQIELVLKEGPKSSLDSESPTTESNVAVDDSRPFELWHYVGEMGKDEAELIGCECGEMETVSVMLTMVNTRVIRASLNINDYGRFPYDILTWKRRPNSPWGVGVGMDINVPQRIINGATRELMNNLGLSSGPQIVLLEGVIQPDNGDSAITPRKVWRAPRGSDIQDVRNAFFAFNIPSIQPELMNTIQWALKMAEDVTGLPMILQGQMGKAPETLGGMQMLSNNASGVLRRIARMADDCVTVPHIQRYYEWLMLYGEEDSEKGDFNIIARGSTALVERELQAQALVQIGQLTLNPAFELSPARYAEELLRSQKINPESLKLTEEEKEAMKNQQPPEPPQVSIAKMKAQIDQMEMQWKSQEAEKDRQLDLTLEAIRAEVKQAEQQNNRVISLDNIKAIMSRTAIETRNKRDLYVDERNLKLRMGQGI